MKIIYQLRSYMQCMVYNLLPTKVRKIRRRHILDLKSRRSKHHRFFNDVILYTYLVDKMLFNFNIKRYQ